MAHDKFEARGSEAYTGVTLDNAATALKVHEVSLDVKRAVVALKYRDILEIPFFLADNWKSCSPALLTLWMKRVKVPLPIQAQQESL